MNEIQEGRWSMMKKIFKRFSLCYLILYIFPYGFEYVFALDTSSISFWPKIVPWFGEIVYGFEFDLERLWSGFDSKYDYSRFTLCLFLSIMGSLAWVLAEKKFDKNNDENVNAWLITIIRYHVGLTMILYGLCKVYPLQFGMMDIDQLEMSIGDHNPMRLLWTFMAHSRFYAISTGWVEVIGGALLLFRASTFIGAVICFVAMSNVVILDIGYDVSVKMFAIHLFLMVIVLLLDDAKRLIDFFILNKTTAPGKYPILLKGIKARKIGYVLKSVLILYFAVTMWNNIQERLENEHAQQYTSLRKFHDVKTFVINGDTLSPILGDTLRWKEMTFVGTSYLPDLMSVSNMDNKKNYYTFKADTVKKTLEFYPYRGDSTDLFSMRYDQLPDNKFVMNGYHKGDTLSITSKSKSFDDYQLNKYGIRWIRDL